MIHFSFTKINCGANKKSFGHVKAENLEFPSWSILIDFFCVIFGENELVGQINATLLSLGVTIVIL